MVRDSGSAQTSLSLRVRHFSQVGPAKAVKPVKAVFPRVGPK